MFSFKAKPLAVPGLIEMMCTGGLFDGDDSVEESAFKHAVERFNMESAQIGRFRLSAQIERLPKNSYLASPKGNFAI